MKNKKIKAVVLGMVIAMGYLGKLKLDDHIAKQREIARIAYEKSRRASDGFVKKHSVLLITSMGSCSGVEVQGPSGHNYILTASHCRALTFANERILVRPDEGKQFRTRIIAIDANSDLMLLEGRQGEVLKIGTNVPKIGEKVHTMTHGAGMPNYRTDGVALIERKAQFPLMPINEPEDVARCQINSHHSIVDTWMGQVCLFETTNLATTASVVPGSSGGAVLNEAGDLIGIVSATDGMFGYVVPLRNILKFMAKR